ncbi:DUF4190 domain-containing protein [Brachybacterium sp. FME24]|uniref:DUF4190 domain-containing protein n=1 Tax=Brachybacterium sp. FME24 TaxID=2742605 RepID=UPI0018661D44|nr:DUF4190 domain-containing protein [Brachybacterium sp. FME24]
MTGMHQGNGYSDYSEQDGTSGGHPAHGPAAGGPSAQNPYAVGPDGTDPYAMGSPAEGYYAVDPRPSDSSAPSFSSQGAGAPATQGPTPWAPGAIAAGGAPIVGQYARPAPTSGKSIAAFILGLASLVVCIGLPAPVGLVFSILGMRETSPVAPTVLAGRGFAIAGLVLNILGLVLLGFMVLYFALLIVLGIFAEMN